MLARIHALLAHYRDRDPLPPAVEAAIAEDWLDDVGEWPGWVVTAACKAWRQHPTKYRYKPLPGDIRALCVEITGKLPVIQKRLERLLASVPSLEPPTRRIAGPDAGDAEMASALEFLLDGLHLTKRLNKDASGSRALYRSRG